MAHVLRFHGCRFLSTEYAKRGHHRIVFGRIIRVPIFSGPTKRRYKLDPNLYSHILFLTHILWWNPCHLLGGGDGEKCELVPITIKPCLRDL